MIASMNIIPGGGIILKASGSPARAAARRWALWTLGLFPLVYLVLNLWSWLESRVPEWIFWQSELVFLIAAEVAYGIAAAVAIVGTTVLGILLLRGMHAVRTRSRMARCFTLCLSLLLASLAAEVASAVWQYRAHRFSAMPVGGFGRETSSRPASRFAEPVAEYALRSEFPDPPADRAIDLVVLGESSAEGVPYSNWLSIGSILIWKMSQAIPGRPIRPRFLARSGDTLEWQHRELANLPRRPDLLVIYCGHNEFTSRLAELRDLDHYFDDRLPTAWSNLVERMERSSFLGGLIHETAEKCRIAIPPTASGRRNLIDVPCYTSTEYTTLLVDFQRRLEAMVLYAEHVGRCRS